MTNDMGETTSKNMVQVGGPSERVHVSLRVFGDDLEPYEVTKLMGCSPSKAFRKGEIESKPDQQRQRIAKTGKWFAEIDSADEMNTAVTLLMTMLTPDLDAWKILRSKYKVDIFCGVFFPEGHINGGFELSPEVLHILAERGVMIGFDIYW